MRELGMANAGSLAQGGQARWPWAGNLNKNLTLSTLRNNAFFRAVKCCVFATQAVQVLKVALAQRPMLFCSNSLCGGQWGLSSLADG
jgi:hypothetical protein